VELSPQQIVDANSLDLAILGKIEHLFYRAAKFIDCKCMLVICCLRLLIPRALSASAVCPVQ